MGDGERPFFGSGSIPKSDWSFAPGRNVQHRLVPLLRQSVYSRLAGYEDTNNAERLAHDPAMRTITGWWDGDRPATSTNTMSRFGTEMLTAPENLEGLTELNTAAWCTASSKGCLHNGHFQSCATTPSSCSISLGLRRGVAPARQCPFRGDAARQTGGIPVPEAQEAGLPSVCQRVRKRNCLPDRTHCIGSSEDLGSPQ
jgi:hypothetical protein